PACQCADVLRHDLRKKFAVRLQPLHRLEVEAGKLRLLQSEAGGLAQMAGANQLGLLHHDGLEAIHDLGELDDRGLGILRGRDKARRFGSCSLWCAVHGWRPIGMAYCPLIAALPASSLELPRARARSVRIS